jgi:uncharacterized protein YbjT (DUF2867 family)
MIVVTGATGNVGRPLVQALAAAGERVTAVSRHTPGSGLPAGVSHRQADLTEPESLKLVLDGADAVFLLVAGEDPQGLMDAVKAGGVRRVVLLSSQGAGTRPDLYRQAAAFEDAVRESGLDWTILQPSGFDSNAFLWAQSVSTQRTIAAPFSDIALPAIDPADIADVAAAVLRDGSHAGNTYVLTGPVLISPRGQAAAIGAALGAQLRFVEQGRAEARAQLLQFMPEPVVDATLMILGEPLDAERRVSSAVEQILGRPGRTFGEWITRNIVAFTYSGLAGAFAVVQCLDGLRQTGLAGFWLLGFLHPAHPFLAVGEGQSVEGGLGLCVLGERIRQVRGHGDLARLGVRHDVHVDLLTGGDARRSPVLRVDSHEEPSAHPCHRRAVPVVADRHQHRRALAGAQRRDNVIGNLDARRRLAIQFDYRAELHE